MSRLIAVRDPGATVDLPAGVLRRPMWVLAAQAGVVLTVVLGAGALGPTRPKVVMLVLACCLVPTFALGPGRLANRIVVSAPLGGILVWWVASYLWTNNVFGWWTDTQVVLPLVLVLVVLVGVLPEREFRSALVVGSTILIGYTAFVVVTRPGLATSNPDGLPGWRGGFDHKNTMGVVMVAAALIVATLARSSLRKWAALATALVLIVMSQSTTALAAGIAVLTVGLLLRRFDASSAAQRATLLVAVSLTVVLTALVSPALFAAGLGIRGKDSTLSRRTDIWAGVIRAIDERPWSGHGIGGVWSDPAVDPARSINRGLGGFTVFHSHNGYLEVLLVLGVVGFGLFLWLLFSTLRLGWMLLGDDSSMATLVVAFVALIVVSSVSEVTFFGIWLALMAALHCFVLRAHRRRTRHEAMTSVLPRLTSRA